LEDATIEISSALSAAVDLEGSWMCQLMIADDQEGRTEQARDPR
jgi:hypothetical protein